MGTFGRAAWEHFVFSAQLALLIYGWDEPMRQRVTLWCTLCDTRCCMQRGGRMPVLPYTICMVWSVRYRCSTATLVAHHLVGCMV